ncbi:MAG: family 10 glycosylhydrolase [Bacteroidota bacterium]
MYVDANAQEMRGAWIARDYLVNRDSIAKAMDSLAANNFNTVFVNIWSRGYPLYPSAVFQSQTGISIDPNFTGRDVLREAIAEAHRAGLHIEAWFEYGFVGGYSGYLPGTSGKGKIFDAHPEWVAKQQNGTEIDGSSFYWMVHTRPDVQNFLIGMAAEIARNYDVDGIELDRIRYSSLSYGYDTYTDSLYRAEHSNSAPPSTTSDATWKQWRADKLNQFIARAYDSIKAINQNLNVSNAPSMYSSSAYSSFDSFCQDWVWWVNNNKVDNVHVQSYVASPSTFSSYIDNMMSRINDDTKIYPSFATKPNSTPIAAGVATQLIDVIRNKGLKGTAVWYYTDLLGYFPEIKANRFTTRTYPPNSSLNWRTNTVTLPVSNTASAVRTGLWTSSANPGYSGNSLYASSTGTNTIEYTVNVPASGTYEVYVFTVISSNRTTAAPFTIYASSGTVQTTVDQTNSSNAGWKKLGDYYFTSGSKKILMVSNSGIVAGKLVSADAVLISLNRKLSPNADPGSLPVELEGFYGFHSRLNVHLYWNTATEQENLGFDIERKSSAGVWKKLGFVEGKGTANSPNAYSYIDAVTQAGSYFYRLRQTDHDGIVSYSPEVTVIVKGYPEEYSLEQNYPNPFNPSTTIRFTVPDDDRARHVLLTVSDLLGRTTATLVNEQKRSGIYSVEWSPPALSSGTYFYTLRAGSFSETKKLFYMK